MSYYERNAAKHIDGSPIFKTEQDEQHEQEVANAIEAAWGVTLHSFGKLAPLDWYAVRSGRLVGVLELKTRTHHHTQYPTVFLNVRKWLALQLASVGLGCPAVFVVRFTDTIMWTNQLAGHCRIGGLTQTMKSRNDKEPVVEIDISTMKHLTAS